jgi:hypothetical protein
MHNHFKNFKRFYLFTCTPLNMFRALLYPSSGAFPSLHIVSVHRVMSGSMLLPVLFMCSEVKAPDDGHNSARNMLNGVQANK